MLTVRKDFDLWTNPVRRPDGSVRPTSFPNHLTSETADGVHGDHPGFVQESWTLTCARPDGTVLQTVQVRVDLGERREVDLRRCREEL